MVQRLQGEWLQLNDWEKSFLKTVLEEYAGRQDNKDPRWAAAQRMIGALCYEPKGGKL